MISGKTKLAAVMAYPIKHSLSPYIHNRAFEKTNTDGIYLAFEINKEQLAQSVEMIKIWGMYGANLSMPYKEIALPLMDKLSPEVEMIGAMNTIVNHQGQLIGYNTDGTGFVKSLVDYQYSVKNKVVTILGTGGAAKAIIVQLAMEKLVTEIRVIKRTNEKSKGIKTYLTKISQETGTPIIYLPMENTKAVRDSVEISNLLINATNVGMENHSTETLISKEWLHSNLFVADIIYQPLETRLLKEAKQSGCQTMNGLGMLVHQAGESFRLWTGKEMPTTEIIKQLRVKFEEKIE